MKKSAEFEVAVAGGGPAGMMAAITAAEAGAHVALVEKNDCLGKKLLLTGGGRCNLANAEFDLRKLVANYGKNGPFLFHGFSVFGPKETIEFFNRIGLETVTENKQRVFPKSMKSLDARDALARRLAAAGVTVFFNAKAVDIAKKGNLAGPVTVDGGQISARNYIIATGGRSYVGTGSTGDGYEWAHRLGHRIEKLKPALVPVTVKETWLKKLSGVSLSNAGISAIMGGKKILSTAGEVLLTHFGLSGPAILDISGRIGELLEKGEVLVSLDLAPQIHRDEYEKAILKFFRENQNRGLKYCLSAFMPQSLALAVCEQANADPVMTANNVTKETRRRLVDLAKNLRITVTGLLDAETGMITGGGVALENIDDKTMRSKIINNLFFAGEILDVHGRTGGFNLQQCWTTGRLAGESAAADLQIKKTE